MDALRFACPGLEDGGTFPLEYTGRGRDLSPEIRLENLSPGVKTLAVTLEDLSHPIKGFTHWVLWNYPAGPVISGGLPRGKQLENGAVQGTAYGLHRYAGPNLPPSARKGRLLKAAEGHILQAGSLTARFP